MFYCIAILGCGARKCFTQCFVIRAQVDIDDELLLRSSYNYEPYMSDYLKMREHALLVEVFCGSIDAYDPCLAITDFVFGIEVYGCNGRSICLALVFIRKPPPHSIEHLFPGTLERAPHNIFGRIRPKVAVFTTPNVEYNVLFDMTMQFRHDDHKFEWSRQQFTDWFVFYDMVCLLR